MPWVPLCHPPNTSYLSASPVNSHSCGDLGARGDAAQLVQPVTEMAAKFRHRGRDRGDLGEGRGTSVHEMPKPAAIHCVN